MQSLFGGHRFYLIARFISASCLQSPWLQAQASHSLSYPDRLLTLIDSKVCIFVEVVFTVKVGPPTIPTGMKQLGISQIIISVASLATNVCATLITLYQTWCDSFMFILSDLTRIRIYRSQIKVYLQDQPKTTQVEKILLLLMESGFAYISIWVHSRLMFSLLNTYSSTIDSCDVQRY